MRLLTLGGLSLEGSSLRRHKPLLLLAYLAVEGPKERRHLRELFWPDALNAAVSLRVALGHLRAESPALLAEDGGCLRLNIESDVGQLLVALRGNTMHQATELYHGAFLDGASVPGWGVELEEWVYATRESIGARVRAVALHHAEKAAVAGEFAAAGSYAEKAYVMPGAPEPEPEELERILTLLLASDHPLAGEVQRVTRASRRGLGLTAAQARERQGVVSPLPLPTVHTSFVGRRHELTVLRDALSEGERLISLTGPGGIGKTRLARELALGVQREDVADVVAWVALEFLSKPEQIGRAIADALGLTLRGSSDPVTAVIAHLAQLDALVVLDNFEHLVVGAPLLSALHSACPGLKVIVTSREPLDLPQEIVLPLAGLPLPTSTDGFLEATQLFMQCARRVQLDYRPGADDVGNILELCRLLEGNPLAIELAAAWVNVIPPGEMTAEVARGLDWLETTTHGVNERHRSLRATFEHSWTLLTPNEQRCLRELSAFQDGFTREAGSAVAGANAGLLSALTHKSLLHARPGGRYDFHALLHHFCSLKLTADQDDAARVRERHARYFLNLAEEGVPQLKDNTRAPLVARLVLEHANFRAALGWAHERQDGEFLLRLSCALVPYWDARGHYREGREWLSLALRVAAHSPLQLQGRCALGRLLQHLGEHVEAAEILEGTLQVAREAGSAEHEVDALLGLGRVRHRQSRYPEAHELYQIARLCAQKAELHAEAALAFEGMARADIYLGKLERAEREATEGLKELSGSPRRAGLLNTLGLIALEQRNLSTAESFLRAALVLEESMGSSPGVLLNLTGLAWLHLLRGDHEASAAYSERVLRELGKTGSTWETANALVNLGHARLRLGQHNVAREHFREALELALVSQSASVQLEALAGLAEVWFSRGDGERATEVFAALLAHPAANAEFRQFFGSFEAELQRALGQEAFAVARRDGEALSWEQVLARARQVPS